MPAVSPAKISRNRIHTLYTQLVQFVALVNCSSREIPVWTKDKIVGLEYLLDGSFKVFSLDFFLRPKKGILACFLISFPSSLLCLLSWPAGNDDDSNP